MLQAARTVETQGAPETLKKMNPKEKEKKGNHFNIGEGYKTRKRTLNPHPLFK